MELVHTILNKWGMTDIWLYQGTNINIKVTQVVKDKFQPHCVNEMANSSKCVLCKSYKPI